MKTLICAPNIEKIECDGGLDTLLQKILVLCRAQKVPIIYCLTKSKLGLVAKNKGTKVALLAVLKVTGLEDLFRTAVEQAEAARAAFYATHKANLDQLRQCKMLAGSQYLENPSSS